MELAKGSLVMGRPLIIGGGVEQQINFLLRDSSLKFYLMLRDVMPWKTDRTDRQDRSTTDAGHKNSHRYASDFLSRIPLAHPRMIPGRPLTYFSLCIPCLCITQLEYTCCTLSGYLFYTSGFKTPHFDSTLHHSGLLSPQRIPRSSIFWG